MCNGSWWKRNQTSTPYFLFFLPLHYVSWFKECWPKLIHKRRGNGSCQWCINKWLRIINEMKEREKRKYIEPLGVIRRVNGEGKVPRNTLAQLAQFSFILSQSNHHHHQDTNRILGQRIAVPSVFSFSRYFPVWKRGKSTWWWTICIHNGTRMLFVCK